MRHSDTPFGGRRHHSDATHHEEGKQHVADEGYVPHDHRYEHKGKHMDGSYPAAHTHIDNRETGGYGMDGCGGFGGGGFGSGLVGGILGGLLFGGRGFGRDGCGGGGAIGGADLALDLQNSIVGSIQQQTTDRDVLETKFDLAIGQCNTNAKIAESERVLEKDIIKCCCDNQLAWAKNELDLFKVKCGVESQIGALACFTKDGFKDVCAQIKQLGQAVNNNSAKQTIAGILSGVTLTEGQELGIQTALGSINTNVQGCCC